MGRIKNRWGDEESLDFKLQISNFKLKCDGLRQMRNTEFNCLPVGTECGIEKDRVVD